MKQISQKKKNTLKMAFLTKDTKNFTKAKLTVIKKCQLGLLYFNSLHFKGYSYLNHKISSNLSVQVGIFFGFL